MKAIAIPEGEKSISKNAFAQCGALTMILLPESLQTIHYNAFLDCTGLAEIRIPNNAAFIAPTAFEGCDGLKMHGRAGGTADRYCQQYGMKYGITFVPEP